MKVTQLLAVDVHLEHSMTRDDLLQALSVAGGVICGQGLLEYQAALLCLAEQLRPQAQ